MTAPALPSNYVETYRHMLSRLASAPRLRNVRLAASWPMRGADFRPGQGMLLVGRATNGWDCQFTLRDGQHSAEVERIVSEASSIPYGLEWVTDLAGSAEATGRKEKYNTNRSPFWRTARQIATACTIVTDADRWSSSLAWSNLYKVAPAATGNPSWSQCKALLPDSIELLKQEIDSFDPAIVMVVAGSYWWAPFDDVADVPLEPRGGAYVNAVGKGRRRWVVACRPEGKPEAAFVAEVCEALAE